MTLIFWREVMRYSVSVCIGLLFDLMWCEWLTYTWNSRAYYKYAYTSVTLRYVTSSAVYSLSLAQWVSETYRNVNVFSWWPMLWTPKSRLRSSDCGLHLNIIPELSHLYNWTEPLDGRYMVPGASRLESWHSGHPAMTSWWPWELSSLLRHELCSFDA